MAQLSEDIGRIVNILEESGYGADYE